MNVLATKEKPQASSTFIDNVSLPVHRWFRFPAGFSAEWARKVIEEQKKVKTDIVLLDPFAGVGTAVLAGEEAEVEAYGLDAQPFIARVACAKLLWSTDVNEFTKLANSVLQDARKYENHLAEYPKLIHKCYPEHILRHLHALRIAWMYAEDSSSASELTWLALTAILRSCSPVGTAPWQYVLPQKSKKNLVSPYDAFASQVQKMASDMMFRQGLGMNRRGKVFYSDARYCNEIRENSITLVVTSPPYANNYDYADATRLEMTYWGEVQGWGDLQSKARRRLIRSCSQHVSIERLALSSVVYPLRDSPIIAELEEVCRQLDCERLVHGGKKDYHLMVAAYFADMFEVWKALRRVCRENATVCFVVGDSAPYGIYVSVDRWLGELAVFAGFKSYRFEKIRDRNVKWKNRKHRIPLHEGHLWVKG